MAAQTQDQSLIHREMQRRAQDIHRVNNPTNQDFKLVWDSYVDTIPANGSLDLPTYKVEKYLREMTDVILTQKQEKAVEEENKKRKSRGEKEMDKWLGADQDIFEGKFAVEKGVRNPQVRKEIYQQLYGGLVKEYGVEKVEKVEAEATPTTHEQIMGEILSSRTPVSDSKQPPILKSTNNTPQTPLEELRQPQLRKLARQKGIETEKTDKKDELIAKLSA